MAEKNIGESTDFLESSYENRVTLRDIWVRILRELDGLDDLERRLLKLESREPTAIVTSGVPNACATYKLMNEYAQEATALGGRFYLIDLAKGGMLKLATLTGDAVCWHLGFGDLVLVALDIENSGRSPFLGERQQQKDAADLQLYFSRRTYDFSDDINLVECSCKDDVRRKFLSSKLTTSLGGQMNR